MSRILLIVLGVAHAATGAWALIAPHSWWLSFPGFGRHWMTPLGPFNDELVRDFGALYLVLAALVFFAAASMKREVVIAASGAVLLFSLLHMTYIIGKLHLLPTGDRIGLMSGLVLTALIAGFVSRPARG
ncbi:MAG: hypothetical protein ACYDCC_05505 [Actinomycetota bacterium]